MLPQPKHLKCITSWVNRGRSMYGISFFSFFQFKTTWQNKVKHSKSVLLLNRHLHHVVLGFVCLFVWGFRFGLFGFFNLCNDKFSALWILLYVTKITCKKNRDTKVRNMINRCWTSLTSFASCSLSFTCNRSVIAEVNSTWVAILKPLTLYRDTYLWSLFWLK